MGERSTSGAERVEPIKLPLRLYQCPGCWSYLTIGKPQNGWIECECGEKMTLIDLRERRSRPLNEDES